MIRSSLVPFALALACAGSTATAQEGGREAYLAPLERCRAVTDEAERLACYDREVAVVLGASERGEVRVVTAEEVRETRRGLFGLSLPRIALFGGGGDGDDEDARDMDMLTSTVTAARKVGRDEWVFRIAEGDAVWRIADAPSRLKPIEPGDEVVFKKASLGTYFIRINGQIGVRGRRVE